ncbi:MAG TPA: tRNA (guanosine(37)-N1)-methyltransferase TrmD [Gammaproteobacteria bacterium]|nr:tRNA (guanosine(37)-N1)-methyltransferase TrmD [Gammaproteobacteria bacterium]
MHIEVVTLFPEMVEALLRFGVTGRAAERGLLRVGTSNPRDHAGDARKTVDDRPYGGGPGMVMKVDTLRAAIEEARGRAGAGAKVIYLSPQGRPLDQAALKRLSRETALVLIAGRYEGVDERVVEAEVDEELSIGDYVLSGGELPALVVIDALARLIPGALGDEDSAAQDSFMEGLLDCPHYTRPEEIDGRRVPEVLLSGDHAAIRRWRMQQMLGRTWQRRPELLKELKLSEEQEALLEEFIRGQGEAKQ